MSMDINLDVVIDQLLKRHNEPCLHNSAKIAIGYIAQKISQGLLAPCDHCTDHNGVQRGKILTVYADVTIVEECPTCRGWTVINVHKNT